MSLIVLSGFVFFTYTQQNGSVLQSIAVGLLIGFAFLQFCCIVLHAIVAPWCCKRLLPRTHEENNNRVVRRAELVVGDAFSAGGYCDSIFDESEPLLPTY